MKKFSLKNGMLIGSASAATQIEGGEIDHSWLDWAKKGHITDKSSPARANEHYRLYREDAELMRDMGMQIYRFGVEWARIEPEEGRFDEEALAHYADELKLLRSYGIAPLVTLHHFTNPMWFERQGAFEKQENLKYFLRFIEKTVASFGELANEYITINEPNVYATNGYFFGTWPPGVKSFSRTLNLLSMLAFAHIKAYKAIHAKRQEMGLNDTKVSFANHVRVFVPENPKNPMHCMYAKLTERFFQGCISLAMCKGRFTIPLRNIGGVKRGRYCDFIAVNYYTRSSVSGLDDGVRKNAPVNDLGWEIYPQGIVECAKKLYEIEPLPIYITENGTCDNEDSFRSRYLYEHIRALCESDLPVERYYHWCFCDNFEWIEGERARFGIVHVDYETQRRTVKDSGRFLSAVIASSGVTEEIFDEFVGDKSYKTNS